MRLDLPHELSRRREPEARRFTPLEPSPVEVRRERLAERAQENRGPRVPPRREPREIRPRPRESRTRAIDHEHLADRRPRRDDLPQEIVGLPLREDERRVLVEVGRFRVIATRDLAETIYNNRHSRMKRDLSFLRQHGLIEVDAVNARRDGRGGRVERIEVVTLTKDGSAIARQTSGLPQNQKLYYGMVKPREVEHDTQIYRAYRKEAEKIEQKGGANLRLRLDFELKSEIQKAIHAMRKADPAREISDIKREVAEKSALPFVDGGIQIPDARIEYDLPRNRKENPDQDQGPRTGSADIEVLTAAYRPGHLHAKAQAGFHVYASSSDRATLTAKIEDDHHLMERILEL